MDAGCSQQQQGKGGRKHIMNVKQLFLLKEITFTAITTYGSNLTKSVMVGHIQPDAPQATAKQRLPKR